jgi:protein-disulfide isomerase
MPHQELLTPRDHVRGPANAIVTLIEYGDYQCPFCSAAQPVVDALLMRFRDDLRLVFRHFPLTEAHPVAAAAAETAEFAGANGKFWKMHELLFANQSRLSLPVLLALAGALDLSESELRDALAQDTYLDKVQADFIAGVRSGVNGTPCFFVNGRRHDGGYSLPELTAAIVQARADVQAPQIGQARAS